MTNSGGMGGRTKEVEGRLWSQGRGWHTSSRSFSLKGEQVSDININIDLFGLLGK